MPITLWSRLKTYFRMKLWGACCAAWAGEDIDYLWECVLTAITCWPPVAVSTVRNPLRSENVFPDEALGRVLRRMGWRRHRLPLGVCPDRHYLLAACCCFHCSKSAPIGKRISG